MKKIKTPIKFIISFLIILLTIYLIFLELEPLITNFLQDKTIFFYVETNKSREKAEETANQKAVITEEQFLKYSKMFPMVEYTGSISYNIYGKIVLDSDTYINLSEAEIDSNLAENLRKLPNLEEVQLYNDSLTNDDKLVLRRDFPNIKFKWMVDVAGEQVDSQINTLDLSKKKINDVDEFKNSLLLLGNLEKLDMSYTNLTNEQLGQLREEFPNIRIDWVVRMSKWSCRTDAVAFSVLVYKYDYRRMTTEDIQVLKYCTELQALDLGHQAIEDITVIGEYLPNLRVLILADNNIKDISPLANLKHLHYLELFMNDITDSSPLASCKELVDLNISFNYRFSDISGIMDLPLLERAWLISDRISADSYRQFRERYPNVKLVTTGNGSTESGWRTHERYYEMIKMYKNNYISDVFLKYDNQVPGTELKHEDAQDEAGESTIQEN